MTTPDSASPKVGERFTSSGLRPVTVIKVTEDHVFTDMGHSTRKYFFAHYSPAPQPVPAAQVLPVQAVVTQAPAWLVVADGRTIATFSDVDDAHAYRRYLNRSTTA